MTIYFVLSIYIATFLTQEAITAGENEIKRGIFPFMAIIYYPDSDILDDMGGRFQRAGILIHESWLISSSIEGKDDSQDGFPKKTLIARLGASHLDANFTLNEDEDEQEREIIQVVRPANRRRETWWKTDVNLLNTLLPFNMTSSVGITTFHARQPKGSKSCIILVYSRPYNSSDVDKMLMKLDVELLPPNKEECGRFFDGASMICATQSKESENVYHDANVCQGYRGGPLLCDGDVVGIQTYVDDCSQPYLYQVLSSWEPLVSCGMEDNCAGPKCSNICESINKDEQPSTKKAAPQTYPSYFFDPDSNNSSKMPMPVVSRSNDEFLTSPTQTTLAEVPTSKQTGIHETESTWQSLLTENSSLSSTPDEPNYSLSSAAEAGETVSASEAMSSMDMSALQSSGAASETSYDQSMEPFDESSASAPEPLEPVDTSILRSSSENVQYEPSPTEVIVPKVEDETTITEATRIQTTEVEDLKVIDDRRKSRTRGEGKDRRSKVEAQLQQPLPKPASKASGAKRIMYLPAVLLTLYSAVLIRLV